MSFCSIINDDFKKRKNDINEFKNSKKNKTNNDNKKSIIVLSIALPIGLNKKNKIVSAYDYALNKGILIAGVFAQKFFAPLSSDMRPKLEVWAIQAAKKDHFEALEILFKKNWYCKDEISEMITRNHLDEKNLFPPILYALGKAQNEYKKCFKRKPTKLFINRAEVRRVYTDIENYCNGGNEMKNLNNQPVLKTVKSFMKILINLKRDF